MDTYWEMVDNPPKEATAVADLVRWGSNYDATPAREATNPYSLFLDIIGVSDELFGWRLSDPIHPLGAMDVAYLAEALNEYAENPGPVYDWVVALVTAELGDEA
jgi:hypothetical protein